MSISVETLALAKKYTDESGGGGGGTSNYNQLSNRPQINGVTLTGNKSLSDIGAIAEPENPSDGDYLVYDDGEWVAQAGSSGGDVSDVQINSTSILSNGVANIPMASTSTAGVVQLDSVADVGLQISDGKLKTFPATTSDIKGGSGQYRVLSPYYQHNAVFYGLAKAAGDTTQASSSNAVGTYTDEAKAAIRAMLGITIYNGSVSG